jgi:hypothetical protein
VLPLSGEIDGATKNIQDAPILMLTTEDAKSLIKSLWTATTERGDFADTQVGQIPGETWSNSGNALEIIEISL